MSIRITAFILFLFSFFSLRGQTPVDIHSSKQITELYNNIEILNDTSGSISFNQIITGNPLSFRPLSKTDSRNNTDVQWLHVILKNTDSVAHTIHISLAFIDYIQCYIGSDSIFQTFYSGDLVPLSDRGTETGQVCFVSCTMAAKERKHCYVQLKSVSAVSRQFRSVGLRSITLYTEQSFTERFETSRIYQALFYGAIVIMLLYNLFISATVHSKAYLIYVLFLFVLIVFLASNNGYIAELFLSDYPRLDLYLRFLSTPLLLACFILFTREYLEVPVYAPPYDKWLKGLIVMFPVFAIIMCSGYWYTGRMLNIAGALLSFIIVLTVSVSIFRKGYKPARYFLIANLLLIIGAAFYALERLDVVAQNPLTQYSVQLSVVFQSIFFSIGLADRINMVQRRLSLLKLENEKLERIRELEKQKLTEEKNAELEKSNLELDTFIYKTAHDIRGPLARLMGLCNVGLLDVSDDKGKNYLRMMKTDADYLNYLLNRLSTAHEIKNIQPEPEPIHLNGLITKILSEISFHEEYKHVRIDPDIPENTFISTDLSLFRFILINLIDNAMTFRKKEGTEESIIRITALTEQHTLHIHVSDNGIGISEEEKPFLFEMFSKAAGKYHTPGLGLYMSALCAAKLKGEITLSNTANPTVFSIRIPV